VNTSLKKSTEMPLQTQITISHNEWFKAKCVLRLLCYLYLQCRNWWLQLVLERIHRYRCFYKNELHTSVFVVELLYTNIAAFSKGKSKCSFQEETGPVGCTYLVPKKKTIWCTITAIVILFYWEMTIFLLVKQSLCL